MIRNIFLFWMFIGLVGCIDTGKNSFKSTDITGADWGASFNLTDHNGQKRTLDDFKGKVVVLFFGFTHCPDVCPTTLTKLSEVMRLLKEDGKRVQVLFVTADPERDNAKVLKDYVTSFHADFLGLYTDLVSTNKMIAQFKAFSEKTGNKTPDTYMMNHSTFTYVYDSAGRIRLMINSDMEASQIVEDLHTLLKDKL